MYGGPLIGGGGLRAAPPAARERRGPRIDSPPAPLRISPPDTAMTAYLSGYDPTYDLSGYGGGGGRCGRVTCRALSVRGAGREYPARPLAAFRAVGRSQLFRLRRILAKTGTGHAMGDAAPHRPRQLSAVRANSIFPLCP